MQEFYIINKKHTTDIHRDLSLIFIELKKYKPLDRGSRAIKELWLRFLTEINEQTEKVDAVMLENPEISQALEIVERSAYSDGDLYAYEDYLLELMTQHNSVESARSEGRAEGEKLGIEKGEKQKAIEMARKLKLKGTMSDEEIAEITDLTLDEIQKI
ncbi:MAG: PD-(D/E)XK nuclease family transposase [Bacteroidales bacterium]|nr:PD-(D/E)XK nuclease family transposase [Bacteroidales bacterium]